MKQAKPPARDKDLTVIFSAEEKDAFRKKCVQLGTRCSTEARRILNAWNPAPAPANGRTPRPQREYPAHGHFALNLPNRASRGGAPRPSRF
ncbi:MAG: hypothetical protein V4724_26810 [Pseudomonadota bacterium]